MAIQIRSMLIFFCSRTTTLWTDRRFNEFHLRAGQVADLGIGQMANLCPPDLPKHEPGTVYSYPAGATSSTSPAEEFWERSRRPPTGPAVDVAVTGSPVLSLNLPCVSHESRHKKSPPGGQDLAGDHAIPIAARVPPQWGCIVLAIASG
jgi:hypothetical protein